MIVQLIPVTSAKEKILILAQLAAKSFQEKEPLLIIAQDENAINYVDALLWREPAESFVPHLISHIPCSALIALSTVKENLNQAKCAINLAQEPLFCEGIKTLYEFDEQVNGPKRSFLEARYQAYREKGFPLHQVKINSLFPNPSEKES
jgi:DNA polymerase III subunit chi